jgi:hypothetical protein
MTKSSSSPVMGYLEFKGPSVDEGKMSAEDAGRSLLAAGKMFKNFLKEHHDSKSLKKQIALEVCSIKKGSTEFGLCAQEITNIAPVVAPAVEGITTAVNAFLGTGTVFLVAKAFGVQEFFKSFMSTMGEQVALKVLSKGGMLKEEKREAIEGRVVVVIMNEDGEKKSVSQTSWHQYLMNQGNLAELVPLEKGKAEKMSMGYFENGEKVPVANVTYKDRGAFASDADYLPARERFNDDFEEKNSEEVKLVGQFMDYYGLAQKYHFSFQARKNLEEVGRQYILCIVPEQKIPQLIDYLKPENRRNITVFGRGTRNIEGKIDKVKITFVSEAEDYNPEQTEMFEY